MGGEESSANDVFKSEPWKSKLNEAAEAEASRWKSSHRLQELQDTIKAVAALPVGEEGKEVGEVQHNVVVGPYTLAAQVGSEGESMAFDFDVHESVVNRALRRKQWSDLAPDVRVVELSPALWDALDSRTRTELVRRRIFGLEDEEVEAEED